MTPAAQVSTSLFLAGLAISSARVCVLAGVAGLGLACFRVKATAVRLFTWTAVLYGALAMPLLEQMLPPIPIPTPSFLQHQAPPSEPKEAAGLPPLSANPVDSGSKPPKSEILVAASPGVSRSILRPTMRVKVIAAGIYFLTACFFLARLVVGLAFAGRLRRSSQVIEEPRLTARLRSRAQASGVAFVPETVESEIISVPVTMGVLSPTILLPDNWREWDDTKLDAVIAHELAHIARRDTLTQRLSLLHCAIFWFSPLAWWLNRHLADLAEQASDEAALACGADRKDYARTLLGFFAALQGAPGRVWWQGVSMANAGRAEQRVERILAWKGTVAMRFKKSIAVVVVTLALPVVYVAASAQPAIQNAGSKPVEVAPAPAPPVPPSAPRVPRPPIPPSSRGSSWRGNDDGEGFVIVTGHGDSLTLSGSQEDGMRVQELREKIPGDFIWFRRQGKSYIIRDQATVDRAKHFWAPQEELGSQQEELGRQQEALGKQQEELGAKMEQVQVKVPDLTKEMEKLQAELKQLGSSATLDQVGELQSAIGELQGKIGDIQSQAGDQQGKLGEAMGVLGEKQGKLGEQQGELGRQQEGLAQEATRQMKQLLDEAIAKGTAQPLNAAL
jgi:beta-lactamase regulating signal transducer with metallopeptidase domain